MLSQAMFVWLPTNQTSLLCRLPAMANKASKEIAENDTKASDKCEGNEQYATLLATKTVLQRVSFPEDLNKAYVPVCQCQPPCLTWAPRWFCPSMLSLSKLFYNTGDLRIKNPKGRTPDVSWVYIQQNFDYMFFGANERIWLIRRLCAEPSQDQVVNLPMWQVFGAQSPEDIIKLGVEGLELGEPNEVEIKFDGGKISATLCDLPVPTPLLRFIAGHCPCSALLKKRSTKRCVSEAYTNGPRYFLHFFKGCVLPEGRKWNTTYLKGYHLWMTEDDPEEPDDDAQKTMQTIMQTAVLTNVPPDNPDDAVLQISATERDEFARQFAMGSERCKQWLMTQDISRYQRFHSWVYEKFITPSGERRCKCGIQINSTALHKENKRGSQLIDHILGRKHDKEWKKLLPEDKHLH